MKNWAAVSLRLGIGVIFLAHGSQKIFGVFGGPGIDGFATALKSMGFNPPVLWAWIAALIEFVGGFLVFTGIFTKAAAGLLVMLMLVAVSKVHLVKGFFLNNGGFEYNLLIIAACISLMCMSNVDSCCCSSAKKQ